MKTNQITATAILLLLSAFAPARAGLVIERLIIEARAGGVIHTSDPFAPLDIPPFVTATSVNGDVQALSLQTKGGFFRNRADINRGTLDAPALTEAHSIFYLVVGTDTPDTPLVLDFHFLGAQTKGSSYFRFGDISANVNQSIQAERLSSVPVSATAHGGDLPNIWGFGAGVSLGGAQWKSSYSSWDTQNIRVPVQTVTPLVVLDAEGYERSSGLVNDLAPFQGTLNFGLLQPGEFFALRYRASVEVRSREAYDLGPDVYANAILVDPFSLGGPPPPQLSLRGLTLPFSASVRPKLDISLLSQQQVRITWPTDAVEYTLESATNLSATLWDQVTITPVVIGDQFAIVDNVTTASKFYRLRKH